jgi:hypothetical protein
MPTEPSPAPAKHQPTASIYAPRGIIERTLTTVMPMSHNGQLRRSTDRTKEHRLAAISLASVVLIVGRVMDYQQRWGKIPTPIR